MQDFDIILGMDFLSKYSASVDCRRRKVIFSPEGESSFEFTGVPKRKTQKFLSSLTAHQMLAKGCAGFLEYIVNAEEEKGLKQEDVRVVCEYPEVFPEELPGLPPNREVEFEIELVPGTGPISKAPYRMSPAELKELQEQLQELLDKGFI